MPIITHFFTDHLRILIKKKIINVLHSVSRDLLNYLMILMKTLTDLFLDVVNNNVPMKQHRVTHKNHSQWLTPDITEAIKSRDRHKSRGSVNECKYWRNKVTKLIKDAKKKSNIKHI